MRFIKTSFCFFSLILFFILFFSKISFASSVNQIVTITGIVSGCGDGVIQQGESCDGINLNNQTCFSLGFSGGSLLCNQGCSFNTSGCVFTPTPPFFPVGGGGGGGLFVPLTASIRFLGRAFPNNAVTILKDAQVAAVVVADSNANFNVIISGLSAGNYIFSVYSEDDKGIRSSLLTFPASVTAGSSMQISGVFIAPTVTTDKSEVKRGDILSIFGQGAPNNEVTINITSEENIFIKTETNEKGIYLYNFDTSFLSVGSHHVRVRGAYRGAISSFSQAVPFVVGARNINRIFTRKIRKGDVNNDGRVNLVDFSIVAFWHRRTISAEFILIERERLNGDGRVNLVDFSIMAYHWTG